MEELEDGAAGKGLPFGDFHDGRAGGDLSPA